MGGKPWASEKNSWRILVLASLAGGMAEVLWIATYSVAVDISAWPVAHAITATFSSVWAEHSAGAAIGITIHFALSVLVAGLFIRLVWAPYLQRASATTTVALSLLSLAAIWLINFSWVLPIVHPAFVDLLPPMITFISKLLFGLALSAMLIRHTSSAQLLTTRFTKNARWV